MKGIIMSDDILKEEKNFITISALGAILGFVIPLIMWALKKDEFSDYTKTFLTDVLNFELIMFIISIILCLVSFWIWLANMLLFVFNLIIVLQVFSAAQDRKEYSFPIQSKLIK